MSKPKGDNDLSPESEPETEIDEDVVNTVDEDEDEDEFDDDDDEDDDEGRDMFTQVDGIGEPPVLIDVPEIPGYKMRRDMREGDDCIVQDVFVNDCYHIGVVPPARTILDVGAHLGFTAARYRKALPDAHIVCVEAEPQNSLLLSLNTRDDEGIVVINGAVTYEEDELFVHSTVYEGCHNTGGSYVGPACQPTAEYPTQYPVRKFTIEEIMGEMGWARLDVLKLDCEGSELSILRHCDLSRIGCIVGEWHNRQAFFALVTDVFGINRNLEQTPSSAWRIDVLRDADIGLFRLNQPQWRYGAA